MTETSLDTQLAKWQRLLLAFSGATVTLLVIVLVELPAIFVAQSAEPAVVIDGWYGVWLVLELACLTPGLALLFAPNWRKLPLRLRLTTGCAYLACAWAALLAFDLRTLKLELPLAFHFAVFALGAALAAGWLIAHRRLGMSEEIFP